jgi:hypothetical protein
MDHSGMDHGDMDHGHGGGMKDMCSMNMLFTWDTNNLCIVFRQWHVRSTTSLLFSLIAVIILAIGYEALRSVSRRYEQALDNRVRSAPSKLSISFSRLCTTIAHISYPGNPKDKRKQNAALYHLALSVSSLWGKYKIAPLLSLTVRSI